MTTAYVLMSSRLSPGGPLFIRWNRGKVTTVEHIDLDKATRFAYEGQARVFRSGLKLDAYEVAEIHIDRETGDWALGEAPEDDDTPRHDDAELRRIDHHHYS